MFCLKKLVFKSFPCKKWGGHGPPGPPGVAGPERDKYTWRNAHRKSRAFLLNFIFYLRIVYHDYLYYGYERVIWQVSLKQFKRNVKFIVYNYFN